MEPDEHGYQKMMSGNRVLLNSYICGKDCTEVVTVNDANAT